MNEIWIPAKSLCHLLHQAFLGIHKKYILPLRDNGGTYLLKRN